MENVLTLAQEELKNNNQVAAGDFLNKYVLIKKLEDLQKEALTKKQPWVAMALISICDAIDNGDIDKLVNTICKHNPN